MTVKELIEKLEKGLREGDITPDTKVNVGTTGWKEAEGIGFAHSDLKSRAMKDKPQVYIT